MPPRWQRRDDKNQPKSRRSRYWAKSRRLEFAFRDGHIQEVTAGLVLSTTSFFYRWDYHRRRFIQRGTHVVFDGARQKLPPPLPNWPSVVSREAASEGDAYVFGREGRPTPETEQKLLRRANDLLFMLDARRRPDVRCVEETHTETDWNKLLGSMGLGVLELGDFEDIEAHPGALGRHDNRLAEAAGVTPRETPEEVLRKTKTRFVATLPAILGMSRAAFERKLLARLRVVFDRRADGDPLVARAAHVLANHEIAEEWWLDPRFEALREEAKADEQAGRLLDLLEDMAVERAIVAESKRAHMNFRFSFKNEDYVFCLKWPRGKGNEGLNSRLLAERDRLAETLLHQARWTIQLGIPLESRAEAVLGPHVFGALLFKCGHLLVSPEQAAAERWTLEHAAQKVGLTTRQVRYAVEKLSRLRLQELTHLRLW